MEVTQILVVRKDGGHPETVQNGGHRYNMEPKGVGEGSPKDLKDVL